MRRRLYRTTISAGSEDQIDDGATTSSDLHGCEPVGRIGHEDLQHSFGIVQNSHNGRNVQRGDILVRVPHPHQLLRFEVLEGAFLATIDNLKSIFLGGPNSITNRFQLYDESGHLLEDLHH